jgi:hypothetical protein
MHPANDHPAKSWISLVFFDLLLYSKRPQDKGRSETLRDKSLLLNSGSPFG